MKKVFSVSLVALLVLVSGVIVGAGAEKTVAPGDSLQEAINSASAGDTILLEPGTYKVNLSVGVPVTLTSEGARAETILEPEDPSKDIVTVQAGEDEPAIENVTIKNLTFQNGDKSGIVLTGSNHKVIGNIVKNIANHGIIPIGGEKVVISNNTVENCKKTGIFVWGTAKTVITGNVLDNNKVAVELTEGATGARIHFNNIVNSWVFAVRTGKPTVDATLNWWGEGADPAEWVSGDVMVDPSLDGPYPDGAPTFLEN